MNKFLSVAKNVIQNISAAYKRISGKFYNDESIKSSVVMNRIIYAAVLISSFIFVYLNGGVIPYLVFELAVAMPLLSLLYTAVFILFVDVTQNLNRIQVIKHEDVIFTFTLKNKSFLFMPFTRINFKFEKIAFNKCNRPFNAEIFPFNKKPNVFTVNCILTGIFEAGIKNVEIYDLLGIFKFTRKVKEKLELTVLPRFLSLEELNASQSAGFTKALSKKALYTDPLSIADIRKYTDSDSFRSVHWKLSAKKNELMVKQNEKTSDNLVLIVVDLYNIKKDRDSMLVLRDQILEYTVSLLYYCLTNEFIVTFVYFSKEGQVEIAAKDMNDFALIYNNILRLDFTGDVKLPDLVLRLVNELPFKHNLIAISNNVDEDLVSALGRAHEKGYNACVYDSSLPIISSEQINSSEIIASLNI